MGFVEEYSKATGQQSGLEEQLAASYWLGNLLINTWKTVLKRLGGVVGSKAVTAKKINECDIYIIWKDYWKKWRFRCCFYTLSSMPFGLWFLPTPHISPPRRCKSLETTGIFGYNTRASVCISFLLPLCVLNPSLLHPNYGLCMSSNHIYKS